MKTKNQFVKAETTSNQKITKVEKMFVGRFENTDVLFVKPENQNPLALELPKDFLAALTAKLETQV